MRTIVLAALVALVSSSKLNQKDSPDCPESTQVFSYNERVPTAAGLTQTGFATGMNGDEDLAQDIIMKGEKFHYIEKLGMTAIPTCTERITTNCQPTCTESLTRGCTEAAAPQPPQRDRFEGKYTFKHER